MRYLTTVGTGSTRRQIERCVGAGRLRELRPNEPADALGAERFVAVIADRFTPLVAADRGIPVLLATQVDRPGLQQFRAFAEAGMDVRVCPMGQEFSEPTMRRVGAARAPTPAAVIVRETRGMFSGLVVDIVTVAAILGNERRCMNEIARACETTPAGIRNALRDHGLPTISGLIARMRCLHALWALESGRTTFWSAAGFRTLAEVSEFLSRHAGAPLGRWKVPGGFASLMRQVRDGLDAQRRALVV